MSAFRLSADRVVVQVLFSFNLVMDRLIFTVHKILLDLNSDSNEVDTPFLNHKNKEDSECNGYRKGHSEEHEKDEGEHQR